MRLTRRGWIVLVIIPATLALAGIWWVAGHVWWVDDHFCLNTYRNLHMDSCNGHVGCTRIMFSRTGGMSEGVPRPIM